MKICRLQIFGVSFFNIFGARQKILAAITKPLQKLDKDIVKAAEAQVRAAFYTAT